MQENSLTTASTNVLARKPRSSTTILLLLLLALVGIVSLFLMQKWGIGATTDSIFYIDGARNLAAGNGYVHDIGVDDLIPITQWPPLFSCVLAVPALFGLDPLPGALWLNSLLFGLNIFLVGLAVHRYAPPARWTAVLASCCALTLLPVMGVHTMAWSEPLFLTATILGAMWLAFYLKHNKLASLLVAAAAFAAMALTRYIGIAMIAGALLTILIHRGRSFPQRLKACLIFAGLAAVPITLWMIRNRTFESSQAYYTTFAWHSINLQQLQVALGSLGSCFFSKGVWPPLIIARIAAIGLGLAMCLWLRIANHRNRSGDDPATSSGSSLPLLLAILIVTYLLSLAFSVSYIAGNIRLDNRAFSPVYFLAIVLILTLVRPQLRFRRRAVWLKAILVVIGLTFVATSVLLIVPNYGGLNDGQGSTAAKWQTNATLAAINKLPGSPVIYSNEYFTLELISNKKVYRIPNRYQNGVPNKNLPREIEAMRQKYRTGNRGLLVYWRMGYYRQYQVTEKQLVQALQPVRLLARDKTATIYEVFLSKRKTP